MVNVLSVVMNHNNQSNPNGYDEESESDFEEFCDASENISDDPSGNNCFPGNCDKTTPSPSDNALDAEADRKMKEELLSSDELEERRKQSLEIKEKGNTYFKDEQYSEALAQYTQALETCPLQFEKDRSILFSNRAACHSKQEHSELALTDCDAALKLQPDYLRCLYRRAELRETSERLADALEDYQHILKIDPHSEKARWACATLPDRVKKQQEEMKEKMMGQLKDLGNMILRPFGLSTDNFKVQKNPGSEGYSINFAR